MFLPIGFMFTDSTFKNKVFPVPTKLRTFKNDAVLYFFKVKTTTKLKCYLIA